MSGDGSFLAPICIAIAITTTRHTHNHVGQPEKEEEEAQRSRIENCDVIDATAPVFCDWFLLFFLFLPADVGILSSSPFSSSFFVCFFLLSSSSLLSLRALCCYTGEVSPPAAVLSVCMYILYICLYRAHTRTSSVARSAIKMAEPKLWSLSLSPYLSPSLPSFFPLLSSVLEPTVVCKAVQRRVPCCVVGSERSRNEIFTEFSRVAVPQLTRQWDKLVCKAKFSQVYRKLRSDCVCCHLVEKKRQTPPQSWSISPLCPLPLSCWHSHLFWPLQFATSDKWVFKLFNLFIFCNVHFNSQSFDYTSNWFFWVLEETGGKKKRKYCVFARLSVSLSRFITLWNSDSSSSGSTYS